MPYDISNPLSFITDQKSHAKTKRRVHLVEKGLQNPKVPKYNNSGTVTLILTMFFFELLKVSFSIQIK